MLVAGSAAAATAPDLVTSTTAGPPTNEPQPQASLSSSADGTRIAFVSSAADLVPGDTNGVADVFVRDLAVRHADPGQRLQQRRGGEPGVVKRRDLGRRPVRGVLVAGLEPGPGRHQRRARRLRPRHRRRHHLPGQPQQEQPAGGQRQRRGVQRDQRRRPVRDLLVALGQPGQRRHQPVPRRAAGRPQHPRGRAGQPQRGRRPGPAGQRLQRLGDQRRRPLRGLRDHGGAGRGRHQRRRRRLSPRPPDGHHGVGQRGHSGVR